MDAYLHVCLHTVLWSDAGFKLYGNMFWPDFWPPGSNEDAQDVVFDMVGLEAQVAGVSDWDTLKP